MSLTFEDAIKGVSTHENSKDFSRYQSWHNFSTFKVLVGYQPEVPCFNAREERKLPVIIVGNEVLLRFCVVHCDDFRQEHNSDVGDSLNVSSMILAVGLECDVWIVLQDTPSWFHYCPKNWISKHIINCIHRIKDDKMRTKIKTFIEDGIKNMEIFQEGYDLSRRQNGNI